MAPKETVLLIHGIQSDGPWFDRVERELETYFDCERVSYKYYRRLGFLKVVAEPWALASGIAATLSLAYLWGPLPASIGGAVTLVIAAARATEKRIEAVDHIRDDIDDYLSIAYPPHAIAHSFGTYLLGRNIQVHRVAFGHVILVGCVLPRKFPWQYFTTGEFPAARSVRNEVGLFDMVVALAGLAALAIRNLGTAGLRGFVGSPKTVHTQANPSVTCKQCDAGRRAVVHNVPYTKNHNQAFVGRSHFRERWIPTLWGLEPTDFWAFATLCHEAYRSEKDPVFLVDLPRLEAIFYKRKWLWADRLTAAAYMKKVLKKCIGKKKVPEGLLNRAVRVLWENVASGNHAPEMQESDKFRTAPLLHPRQAAAIAAISVFESDKDSTTVQPSRRKRP